MQQDMIEERARPGALVVALDAIEPGDAASVGGKAAHLAVLSSIAGIRVPSGFVVTTHAYAQAVASVPGLPDLIERLAALEIEDGGAWRALSGEIRHLLEHVTVPAAVRAAVAAALVAMGRPVCAVRSSATAEDLPTASFAGQHDTFLNVRGDDEIVAHVARCWASLFSERAVGYRKRNDIDERSVRMAVVVQQMVDATASGVVFTADPLTSDRTVSVVEAAAGLGEAYVSGHVDADVHRVRDGVITSASCPPSRPEPILTDAQVLELAALGRRIEAGFGAPQDIEWCLVDPSPAPPAFHVVQSRPITTLFPVPAADDDARHVYVSVGHQQMMTDAMQPLGLSLFQMTALPRMYAAGGRLFVDVAAHLASPTSQAALMALLGKSDPLIGDALRMVIEREFIASVPDQPGPVVPGAGPPEPPLETDPAIVAGLIARNEASIAALRQEIASKSGTALLEFIRNDIQELKRLLFEPLSRQVVMAGMEAAWWLDDHIQAWLGETQRHRSGVADLLTRSVPGNVTSEMGLALLDVADVIRPHAEVVAFLHRVGDDDSFLDAMRALPGGDVSRAAIFGYLERYGMRCVGEIDITRPRWSERPSMLLPALLGNIEHFPPGAGAERFAQGQDEASHTEQELLRRVRALPDGDSKAVQVAEVIARLRTFAGYREYPKYGMISRYFVYKQAVMAEAERLVQAGVIAAPEDVFALTFDELEAAVRTGHVDAALIRSRQAAFRIHRTLTPPRVMTSDGEVIAGAYRRADLPDGAMVGLGVSAGVVEGRARIVRDMSDAIDLEPTDILVTAYTDPSWTPLFVAVAALVTEVGGLMTHGAVIAREYGLPAVVGVQQATTRIRDGARIRVHGTDGFVELL